MIIYFFEYTRNYGGNDTFQLKLKTPVGASSELLINESLSRSFKRFVQTTDSSDVYAWANETLTQLIRSKHWIIQQLLIAVRWAVVQPKM